MSRDHLTILPITLRRAAAFVTEHHRHHKPPRGAKFALGVADEAGELRGVITVGRPVARSYDDGLTAEVNRSATDGCPNANSALYGAAWRVCQAMGYRRLITYTQEGESGASLRGAGWSLVRSIPPTRTFDVEDFANGPLCLNCGDVADHGIKLGGEVHNSAKPRGSSLVAFRLDAALLRRLSDEASRSDRSLSAVVRMALRRYLP